MFQSAPKRGYRRNSSRRSPPDDRPDRFNPLPNADTSGTQDTGVNGSSNTAQGFQSAPKRGHRRNVELQLNEPKLLRMFQSAPKRGHRRNSAPRSPLIQVAFSAAFPRILWIKKPETLFFG
ncbi:protein of unknown function (plasmid) [Azospirillum lipoferum 4B]|uniref:Uncharacterized protein n=1 Tax=Azospirillum lipoferum (strain 4B) TaxID=862719 RepID=G7ZE24_AZOL4|nr:protein of unknown function [Azospirillum lipoferum 4B]